MNFLEAGEFPAALGAEQKISPQNIIILKGKVHEAMDSKFNQERRDVLKGTCGLVGAAAVMSVGVSTPAFAEPQKDAPQVGDVFVFLNGPKKGAVAKVDDIAVGADAVSARAKDPKGDVRDGDNFIVLLYRVPKEKVPSDMAGDTVDGVMCYSAICTHQGCTMDEMHKPEMWFICPCHDAEFDPLQMGKNTGGATCHSLAYFPVKSDGGTIVMSGLPSGPVGIVKGR